MSKQKQIPSAVLLSLLNEYQISPLRLSKEISLSYSMVRQLLFENSKFTAQTAVRLAKFFGQTPEYWLDLQNYADLQEAAQDKKLAAIVKKITRAKKQPASSAESVKPKSGSKTLADKRKKAAKVPGAKSAARKKR